jgi:peptidoglycan/LPS O-acetylase OafA/YrhL
LFYNKFKAGTFNYLLYIKSRFFRILPTYILVVSCIYLASFFIEKAPFLLIDFSQTLLLFYYIKNQEYSPILPVSWSLEIEFIFYIAVPYIVSFIRMFNRLFIIIGLYLIFVLLKCTNLSDFEDSIFNSCRLFLLGFFLAEIYSAKIVFSLQLRIISILFGFYGMIIFVESVFFDFFLFLFFISFLQFTYCSKVFDFISKRSFAIYLFHLPFLYVYFKYLNILYSHYFLLNFFIHFFISSSLILFFSDLIYKYFEKRFI